MNKHSYGKQTEVKLGAKRASYLDKTLGVGKI